MPTSSCYPTFQVLFDLTKNLTSRKKKAVIKILQHLNHLRELLVVRFQKLWTTYSNSPFFPKSTKYLLIVWFGFKYLLIAWFTNITAVVCDVPNLVNTFVFVPLVTVCIICWWERVRKGSTLLKVNIKVGAYTASANTINRLLNRLVRFQKLGTTYISSIFRKLFNAGFQYITSLGLIFGIDALLTDDEPLWEPVEWSLIQYWLIFIYLFAWIAENLITSRHGSYTDRDKRVWFAWYKTFWFVEIYYAISLGAAASFVIVPFYYELTYVTPFIASWWDWYSTTFFFKFTVIYTIVLTLTTYLQFSLTQLHWKKSVVIISLINIFLAYLLYVQFFITFFAYFTDANWYAKTRLVDYVQLSLEPNKWAWGNTKRDHFSYHSSKTVFWFKNDGPFASAMLFFNILFFLALFTVHLYWLTLLRKFITTREVTYTYTTFCVSSLRQFLYFFNITYLLVLLSLLLTYWRLPCEFYWVFTSDSSSLVEVLISLFN